MRKTRVAKRLEVKTILLNQSMANWALGAHIES